MLKFFRQEDGEGFKQVVQAYQDGLNSSNAETMVALFQRDVNSDDEGCPLQAAFLHDSVLGPLAHSTSSNVTGDGVVC